MQDTLECVQVLLQHKVGNDEDILLENETRTNSEQSSRISPNGETPLVLAERGFSVHILERKKTFLRNINKDRGVRSEKVG